MVSKLLVDKLNALLMSALCLVLSYSQLLASNDGADGTRTLSIQTEQVTRPDVTVSPDGKWIVYSSLGKLFRLPVTGGTPEQLTFGAHYDSDPAISPDGKSIVFASDRDLKSNGNLYLMDIASRETRKITNEEWAARPVWSPDGDSIAYIAYEKRGPVSEYEFVDKKGVAARVKQLTIADGAIENLTPDAGAILSAFYLPSGEVGWTIFNRSTEIPGSQDTDSRPEAGMSHSQLVSQDENGDLIVLHTVAGVADRVVAVNDGFYFRQYHLSPLDFLAPSHEALVFISSDSNSRELVQLSNPQPRPAFAVMGNDVYLGQLGSLWHIDTESGERSKIPFSASIEVAAYAPITKAKPGLTDPNANPQVSILDPRLSPNGKALFFTAAGYIWRQSIESGDAQRVIENDAFQFGPGAISPDGLHLAYQHSNGNHQELRVVELSTGREKTLVSSDRTGRFEPAWSPDGETIVYAGFSGSTPSLYLIDMASGSKRKILDLVPRWMPRPHFSGDGEHIYYTSRNQVFRIDTGSNPSPKKVTDFRKWRATDGTISPDGKWLAYRINEEIWVAPLNAEPITDDSGSKVSSDGGLNYSFAPDSSALIFSSEGKVWQHSLEGGSRDEIPVSLALGTQSGRTTFIKNVQVLDFEIGGFVENAGILIQDRRIQQIGGDIVPPEGANIIDAKGRFAIPGLFDAHTHLATPIHFNPARDVSRMSANIAYGVTSARDMGSDITMVKAWENRRANFGLPVPRIFSGGAMTETAGPFFHGGSFFVASEEQAREIVRKQVRDGVVAIKSYFTLPWSLHRVIADEARKLGVPVVAHGMTVRETIMGPILGRTSIEHQPTPTRMYDDVLQLIAKSGTQWCPTVAPFGGNGVLYAQKELSLSSAKLRSLTSRSDYALAEGGAASALDAGLAIAAYKGLIESVGEAHRSGVKLLAGTDALNPNVFYGHGLHGELLHLQRAKIPPIDILRIATLNAATTVGAESDLGSLEEGKLADIVLLDRNPLVDIKNTMSIWRVFQDGRAFVHNVAVSADE